MRLFARVRLFSQAAHCHAIHVLRSCSSPNFFPALSVIAYFDTYLSVHAHHSEVLLGAFSRCLEALEFFEFCPAAVEERLLGAYLSRCCLCNQLMSPMTHDNPYTKYDRTQSGLYTIIAHNSRVADVSTLINYVGAKGKYRWILPVDMSMAVGQDRWELCSQQLEAAPVHSKNGRLAGITIERIPPLSHAPKSRRETALAAT